MKVGKRVEQKQSDQQKFSRDNRNAKFEKEEIVMAKDYANDSWQKVRIIDQLSPVTYTVETPDRIRWKRHTDQLQACQLEFPLEPRVSDSNNGNFNVTLMEGNEQMVNIMLKHAKKVIVTQQMSM